MLKEMDHRYIDEHSVAQRYVGNALEPQERVEFETHLVDCQECTDRVLLAEMFHARKAEEDLPLRARLAARVKPWQMAVIFALTVLLLTAIPALLVPVLLRWLH
ncbi:MAG: hypothetical protein LAO79_03675 [Acidobacteriia bacterium]|nr:hypothetical protein [Terriglobia bacterium]